MGEFESFLLESLCLVKKESLDFKNEKCLKSKGNSFFHLDFHITDMESSFVWSEAKRNENEMSC